MVCSTASYELRVTSSRFTHVRAALAQANLSSAIAQDSSLPHPALSPIQAAVACLLKLLHVADKMLNNKDNSNKNSQSNGKTVVCPQFSVLGSLGNCASSVNCRVLANRSSRIKSCCCSPSFAVACSLLPVASCQLRRCQR